MIAIKTQTNLRNARQYFREHLSSGDYYTATAVSPGTWLGKGVALLGLEGTVRENDFAALYNGLKPDGTKLTKRINTVRTGGVANRRIFFDWTVSPPKSVPIGGAVTKTHSVRLYIFDSPKLAVKAVLSPVQMARNAARRVVRVQLVVASVEGESAARNPIGEAADRCSEVRTGMAQIVFSTGQTQHHLTHAAVAVRHLQRDQGRPEIGDPDLDSRGMCDGYK
jgi:hypothetical protein